MDDIVRALADERAGYLRGNRGDKVIAVEEQLLILGYAVDSDGALIEVDPKTMSRKDLPEVEDAPETAELESAPERAVPEKPQRRTRRG